MTKRGTGAPEYSVDHNRWRCAADLRVGPGGGDEAARGVELTNAIVRDRLGLSRNEAVWLLGGLTADGLLELRGSKRGAHYVPACPDDLA